MKTKKQSVSGNDYQSMLKLFNMRILTLSGAHCVPRVFRKLDEDDRKCNTLTSAVFMRFCDENAGHISFAFSNLSNREDKPLMGSLSSEQIKDFKQGIVEILMDEAFLKRYDRIVQLQVEQRQNSEYPRELPIVITTL
ncbi:unnamed protein product [Gongylonema pulchrum]|uniref:RGS domain-containing protein n=1 Tax=Gongylonema pulchrum TaxID=637853 RepID=A0A183DQV8_9BILA|nr:unnamed protein product [Gongylonema pulchrum]